MAIADLKNVLNIFGGEELSGDKQNELFKEVLLMTLARAADADINIQSVEVERIQEILKEHTGDDFSAADIRVAARAELYAEATLASLRNTSASAPITWARCASVSFLRTLPRYFFNVASAYSSARAATR
ncbi:MAG: hypothetical protein AAFN50_02375, partial [Pseudomonadota bacterium]